MEGKRYHITTPIYYINDNPHIGHLYTSFAADLTARFLRFLGKEINFVSGTDENSQKTVEAAKEYFEKEEVSIGEVMDYTDKLAEIWKNTWSEVNVSIDDFIRTTEERHRKAVEKLYYKLKEKGYIYKGKYKGLYCRKCENFYKEEELIKGEKGEFICPDHKKEVESIEEENYFFRLSSFTQDMLDFFEKNPDFIHPSFRIEELRNNFLEAGLEDISISREGKEWGLKLPDDDEHVFYVWFDALINYMSVVGYGTDEDFFEEWRNKSRVFHFLGKDIIKFHGIFWPVFLMGAGEKLPDKEVINGYFTLNGEKISKSLGNTVDPRELINKYGVDAIKYYLFVDLKIGSDGDFSFDRLDSLYNNNLLAGWGNLVSRVSNLSSKNGIHSVDLTEEDINKLFSVAEDMEIEEENSFLKMFSEGFDESFMQKCAENVEFTDYIQKRFQLVQLGNKYLEITKPWEKIKNQDEDGIRDLKICLYLVKNIALLSAPLLIESFEKIKEILGIDILNKVDTNYRSGVEVSQIFDMRKFEVNISPDYLYKKIE